jgi:hypothetical protein
MIAMIENMEKLAKAGVRGVMAWSPLTGEEYSATAADYWQAPAGWTMLDAEGEPMLLVREVRTMEDVKL